MTPRIFIVDTNVIAAGLITKNPESPTVRILDAMLAGTLIYLLSPDLLNEYRDVLLRPRLVKLHGLQKQEIEQILLEITANALWREPPEDREPSSPDPCDRHLWALLASEPESMLITGDHLLIENPRPQSAVISPSTWDSVFSGTE